MNDTLVQAGMWIGAGLLLVMFLSRRRRRRAEK